MAPALILLIKSTNSTSNDIHTTNNGATLETLIKDNLLYVIIGGSVIILCIAFICCMCLYKKCHKKNKPTKEEDHMANNVLFGVGGNELYRVRTVSVGNENKNTKNKSDIPLSTLNIHNNYSNMDETENDKSKKGNISPKQKIETNSNVPNGILVPTQNNLNATKQNFDSSSPLKSDNEYDMQTNGAPISIGISETLNANGAENDEYQIVYASQVPTTKGSTSAHEMPNAINMDEIEMDSEEDIDSETGDEQDEDEDSDEYRTEEEDSDSFDMFTPVPQAENREITLKQENVTDTGLDVIEEQNQNGHVHQKGTTYMNFIKSDIKAVTAEVDLYENDTENIDIGMDETENRNEPNSETIAADVPESESVDNKPDINAEKAEGIKNDTKNTLKSDNASKSEEKVESVENKTVSKDETKNVLNNKSSNGVTETNMETAKTDTIDTVQLDINALSTRSRARTVDVQHAEDGQICVAIHDFDASNTDEISVTEGHKYTVVQGGKDDWWYVQNVDGGQGWVASSFLRPIKTSQ